MTAIAARSTELQVALDRVAGFPRMRYMGSKYNLAPRLAEVFADLGGSTFLDAFSGSGFVSYLAKALGYRVTSNDYMEYGRVLSSATVVAEGPPLDAATIERIAGPAADDRTFIRDTYAGIFYNEADLAFLDSAWSHIATMEGTQRDQALAALILSAARKQPRGVFTISGDLSHYNDGRRDLSLPMREHFLEHVLTYGLTAFTSGLEHTALRGDALALDGDGFDVVYLDPPYAAPSGDDTDYTKRYHFLEGLATYWEDGQAELMWNTKTRKLPKRKSGFSSRSGSEAALQTAFQRFAGARALVVSYSSNSHPGLEWMLTELQKVKRHVEVLEVPHRYHFGNHGTATRRQAVEYIFTATD